MRRFVYLGIAAALSLTIVLSGCQHKVSVESGEKVVCQYGDVISNTVTTIQVPADQASAYTVTSSTGLCERHERILRLYAQAQAALTVGDTKTAKAKLQQVVAADPKFEQATKQLAEIKSGKKPAPDASVGAGAGSSGGSASKPKPKPGTPNEPEPVGPVVSLQRWVPPTLQGYRSGTVSPDVLTISREYVAEKGDVEAVVISAEQYSSKSAASSALKQLMYAYSKDRASERLAGRDSTLGTDGKQFAAVGFSDGPIVVVIEAHAKSSGSPKGLFGAVREIATSLPTK